MNDVHFTLTCDAGHGGRRAGELAWERGEDSSCDGFDLTYISAWIILEGEWGINGWGREIRIVLVIIDR